MPYKYKKQTKALIAITKFPNQYFTLGLQKIFNIKNNITITLNSTKNCFTLNFI